jgi:WD40 repeat protein
VLNGGTNGFDFDSKSNLLATANQNTLVNLFNPYVSEPTGILKGHSRVVLAVKFIPSRAQLISFSADKVMRVWNVQLQICIQKISSIFPKGPEVDVACHFDDLNSKFFIAFRFSLFMMEIKPEVVNRIMTHTNAAVAVRFNKTTNQVSLRYIKKLTE